MASTLFLAEQLDLKSIAPNSDFQKSSENEIRSGIPCWKDDKRTYCDPPVLFQPSTEVLRFTGIRSPSKSLPIDVNPSAGITELSRASIVISKASNLSLAVSEVREAADLELRIQRGFVPMRVLTVHADRMLDTMKEMLEKLNFFRVLPQVISEISIDDSQFPLPKEFEASLLQLLHVQATWQYIDDQTPQPTSKFLRRLMHFAQSKLEQGIPAPTASLSLIPKSRHPELQDEDQKPPTASSLQNRAKSAGLPSDCYRADTAETTADSLTDLKQLYDWDAETDALGAEMEHAVNKKLRSKMLEILGLNSSTSGALEDLFGGTQDFMETKKPKKKLRICRLQRDGTKCCEAYSKARTHRPKTQQQQNYAYEESDEDDQYTCSVLDAVLDDVYNLGLDPYIFKGVQKGPNSKQTCTVTDMSVSKRLEVLEQLALKKPAFFESLVAESVDWSRAETQSDRSLLLLSAVKGQFGKHILGALLEENLDSVLQYVQLHVDHYKELYADEARKCPGSADRPKTTSAVDTWRQKWRQHLGVSEDEEQSAGNSNWKLLRNNKTKQMILMKKYKDQQGQWRTRKIPLNDQGQPEILEEKRMRKAGSKLTTDDLSKLAQLREEFGEDMPVVALKKYLWRARRAEKTKLDEGSDQEIGAFDEFYETSDDSSEIPEDETDLNLLKVQDASPANAPTSKNTKTLSGYLGLPAESQDQDKIDLLTPTLNPGRWNHIEKLIAGGNHNLSQEHIERHLRGAYREAFRQAYMNREKLAKYVEEFTQGARGTRALKQFVGQFQMLLRLMQERMLVTPEEEVMKIHVLRQTWIREQRLLQLLEGLKNKYSDLRSERDLKIAKLNETISSLMTQIDTVYAHTRQELSMVISEYSKMELLTNKSADHSQQGLQGVLQRCAAAGSAFRAKYAEIEEDLQKQKRKHEAELEAVIAQYDTEMFDRQSRLDKLEQDFKEQQVEVDKLEEELKKVELRTGQMEDEERKKALKRRKRKKRKKGKSKKRSKRGKKGKSRSRRSKKRKGKSKKKRSKKTSKKSKMASDTDEEEDVSDEETGDEEEETDAEESEVEVAESTSKPKSKKRSKKKASKTAKRSKNVKSSSKTTKKAKKKTLKSSPEDVEVPTSDTEEEETEAGGDASLKKPTARGRKTSKKRKRSKKSKRAAKPGKTSEEGAATASSVTSTNSFVEPQKIASSAEVGSEASLKTSTTETTAKSVSASEVALKKLKKHSKKKSKKMRSKSRKKSKKRKRKSRK